MDFTDSIIEPNVAGEFDVFNIKYVVLVLTQTDDDNNIIDVVTILNKVVDDSRMIHSNILYHCSLPYARVQGSPWKTFKSLYWKITGKSFKRDQKVDRFITKGKKEEFNTMVFHVNFTEYNDYYSSLHIKLLSGVCFCGSANGCESHVTSHIINTPHSFNIWHYIVNKNNYKNAMF